MTNKYSGLSDFEVNKLVAEKLGYKYVCDDIQSAVLVEGVSSGYGGYKTIIVKKNYCFDKEQAMSLMIDNGISLIPSTEDATWIASAVINYRMSCFPTEHTNPCRAIAECFLLMKDAENNNDK